MSAQLSLPLGHSAPTARPKSIRVRSSFDAGMHTRRTLRWIAPTQSPNTAVLSNLTTLRDRSRAAVRNDGFAKGMIDGLVRNIIGTGLKPLSQAADPDFRKAIQALWLRWTDESESSQLLDWYGQQRQAVMSWLEAGEVFVRFRERRDIDRLSVPIQAEILEAELCPHTLERTLANGNKVRAGIEFDRIGRRVAYWFYALRPGDPNEWDVNDLRRVDARFVVHMFDQRRPGQIRGIPQLTQALIRLHELDKYDDATLLRNQLANLFALFVTQNSVDTTSDVHPVTGVAADATQDDRPVVALEPGLSQHLDPDEDVKFSEPPDPPATYPNFMKQQLISACAAVGMPYEVLTGDWAGLNDRIARVILHEFRRGVMPMQHQIVAHQLCRPIWNFWLDRIFTTGAVPIPSAYADDPRPWSAVMWMPQGWPYIHPVQDVDSQQKAIKAGFTSRSATVSEQGEDSEVIDEKQAADNARARELGLVYETSTGRPAPAPVPEGATA